MPSLADRKTRVVLLASSYHDACEGLEREYSRSTGKPGSRLLVRSALWLAGSYAELERLLDALRSDRPLPSVVKGQRELYRCFWAAYVGQRFPAGAELGQRQRDTAAHALGWLVKRMPATLHVPYEVSVNAGYLPSEARAYARLGELRRLDADERLTA